MDVVSFNSITFSQIIPIYWQYLLIIISTYDLSKLCNRYDC